VDCALMIEGQEGVSWSDWVALAETCEAAGLDGLYRSDHYLSFTHPKERGGLDAWVGIAALSAITSTLRLGTLVSPVGFRAPGVLAKLVASASEISGGRVELGLGAGWFEDEYRAFGLPFPTLRERYAELKEALATLDSLLPRLMPERPRLILGGDAGPSGAALAARYADEYNVLEVTPELVSVRRQALAEACCRRRRDPDTLGLSLMINTIVGRDEGEVRERVGRAGARPRAPRGTGELLASRGEDMLTGMPEQVLEQLREFGRRGVRRVMLQHVDHADLDMVRLIGAEIAPELRALEPSETGLA
jgi:alkanesulfonate monooxygenase SsuD/methylene tetrahydromethanopterin reductase-like flavin-dependent oxidoreductase (luciferase family)